MNARSRTAGLIAALMLASAACSALAAPRASDDAQELEKMRAAVVANAEKALARQGGSKILFKVDSAALREAVVTELRDDLYRIVREGRIPFAGLALRDGGVEVRIADAKDRQRVLGKLVPGKTTPSAPETVSVTDNGDGLVRLMPTEAGFAGRLHELVRQSGEMIDQRLRNSGIREAGVQPDEADRIRVLLPDVRDPERVTAIFAKRARITFRLIDVSVDATQALQNPPAGSEVLRDFKTKEPYLVLKEAVMEGDDIIDASPGFDARTLQAIATFRFNGRGTRRFASVTQENVGRPFAIIVDDQVLSAPVIREPILGGSGQIAGNFTIEDASNVATLLRSGTLPGRLTVVDQQVIEPVANAGKP